MTHHNAGNIQHTTQLLPWSDASILHKVMTHETKLVGHRGAEHCLKHVLTLLLLCLIMLPMC